MGSNVNKIDVYTDGSGMTKETAGGYGYVVVRNGVKLYEGSGHMKFATNNDAELQAAIEGLSSLQPYFESQEVTKEKVLESTLISLVSDSRIILGWASGRYEFKQEDKYDKYDQLQMLMSSLKVTTRWVRGHNGDEFNEQCDKLANAARLSKQEKTS